MVSEAIFELDILHRREFGKQAQILRQIGNVVLANLAPLRDGECANILAIKRKSARIIHPIAIDIGTETRLSGAAFGRNQIVLAAHKLHFLQPDFAVIVFASGKHGRQRVM